MSSGRLHFWVGMGLASLTLASLGRVCNCGFISLDDPVYVVDNAFVQQGLTAASWQWAWTTFHCGFWQPLTWLSLQLDAAIHGYAAVDPRADPMFAGAWGFHLTNLLLHLANVLLLYWVLVRMTGADGRAAVVAALFAVHPLHVESVAWVTERKDVLSTLFFLLALLAYCRYVNQPRLLNYLVLFLLAFLGMAAKSMVVTLPPVLLLLDYWPLQRLTATTWKRALVEKIPLLLLSLIFSILTMHTQAEARVPLSLEQRLTGTLAGYGWYLEKTFWPTDLCALYLYENQSFSSFRVIFPLYLVLGATLLALWFARTRPYGVFGWLWFLGMLFPVSGMFQSGPQSWADRFSYLPHIGLFIALVWGLADFFDFLKVQRVVRAILVTVLLGVLSVWTWHQAGYWKDTPTMFFHALEISPSNHRAFSLLATYFCDRGNYLEAIRLGERAVALSDDGHQHFILAVAHAHLGQADRALFHIEEDLRQSPERPDAHLEAATVYDLLHQTEKVAWHLHRYLTAKPGTPRQYFFLARALVHLDQKEQAVEVLHKSLEMNPRQGEVHQLLGTVLAGLGRSEESQIHLSQAQQLGRAEK